MSSLEMAAGSSKRMRLDDLNSEDSTEPAGKRVRYHLGNNTSTDDRETAEEHLLERDFPEIADGTLRRAVFAPDTFVPKHPEVPEYPSGKPVGGKQGLLAGEETERLAYDKLKGHAKDKIEAAFIANSYGYRIGEGKNAVIGDIDILVLRPQTRSITILECKRTLTNDSLEKAKKQVAKAKLFLSEILVPDPGWTVNEMVVYKINEEGIQDDIALSIEEFCSWWEPVEDEPEKEAMDSFRFIVKKLIFHMTSRRVEYPWDKAALTSRAADGFKALEKEIYFLTKKQHRAVLSEFKRVLIQGDFGTGKTIILREKAIRVANDNPEDTVYFIAMHPNVSSGSRRFELCEVSEEYSYNLQDLHLMRYFKSRGAGNIKVMTWRPSENPLNAIRESFDELMETKDGMDTVAKCFQKARETKRLEKLVKNSNENAFSHFFIDESNSSNNFLINWLDGIEVNGFDLDLKRVKTLYIAKNGGTDFSKRPRRDFKLITLMFNLRNCKAIVNSATGWTQIPYKAPDGRVLDPDISALELTLSSKDGSTICVKNAEPLLKNLEAAYREMKELSRMATLQGKPIRSTDIAIIFNIKYEHFPDKESEQFPLFELLNQVYKHFKEKVGRDGTAVSLHAGSKVPGVLPISESNISGSTEESGALLITDMHSAQGMEFASVIHAYDADHLMETINDQRLRNARLRAVVNLKEVKFVLNYR